MTDIFEQVQRNGGTYTERRRQKIGQDEYRHIVVDYSRRFAVVTFFLSLAAVFLLNALAIYAISPERLFWLFRPGIEWALMLVVAFINGSIAFLYNISVRMNEFVDLAFEPTERTAQISPESAAMQSTGANTAISTIPYNTAQNSANIPRRRGDVTLHGFVFWGALLDAMSPDNIGLNRDGLRRWWAAYQERNPQTRYRFNWQEMTGALGRAGYAMHFAGNRGWDYTADGLRWIKEAGQPPPPQT